MFIVWRGWGIVAIPVIAVSMTLVSGAFTVLTGNSDYWSTHTWPFMFALLVAGAAVYGVGALLGDGHDLFFIPLKMWGALCGAAVMIGVVTSLVAKTETRPDSPVAAKVKLSTRR